MKKNNSKQIKRHLNIEAVFNVLTAIIVVIVTMVMILLPLHWIKNIELESSPIAAGLVNNLAGAQLEEDDGILVPLPSTEPTEQPTHPPYELPTLDGGSMTVDSQLIQELCFNAKIYGVPEDLVLAICYVESGFDPKAHNKGMNSDGSTDWGLMALNDTYYEYYCDTYNGGQIFEPLNASQNMHIGIQILSDLYTVYNDMYNVANAYNMGVNGWEEYKSCYGHDWYYGQEVLDYVKLLHNRNFEP